MSEIGDILNLDTWTETAGMGSVDSVVCPHCRVKYPPGVLRGPGLYYCGFCQGGFTVRTADSPLGKAYLTEAAP